MDWTEARQRLIDLFDDCRTEHEFKSLIHQVVVHGDKVIEHKREVHNSGSDSEWGEMKPNIIQKLSECDNIKLFQDEILFLTSAIYASIPKGNRKGFIDSIMLVGNAISKRQEEMENNSKKIRKVEKNG